ncbi:MAG: SDR family oxidoreductase [Pirellulaceae bacterium]
MSSSSAHIPQRMVGKVGVITGSTQGLGEAIARRFVHEGMTQVVITGRNAERGESVRKSLEDSGAQAVFVQADLADIGTAKKLIGAADDNFGRVDVLVNSAAVTDRSTILDTTPEFYDWMTAVNVRSPFFLIQEAAKVMRREKIAGSIINIQSMSAHGGQPFLCVYSLTKGAMATLTKNSAFSLMLDHIRVNGLNIGWMNTEGEDVIMKKYHGAKDGWLDEAVKSQPFGRLVEPEEIGRLCAYLGSEDSGMLTGALIDFDQSVDGCYEYAPHPSAPVSA